MIKTFKFSDFLEGNQFPFNITVGTLKVSSFEMHTHEFSELVIILGGNAIHCTEKESFRVSGGDIFVLNGKAAHGFQDCRGLQLCNIMYDPELIFKSCHDASTLSGFHALFVLEPYYREESRFKNRLKLNSTDLRKARENISDIYDEFKSKKPGFETMIIGLFLQLVINLSRKYSFPKSQKTKPLHRLADVMVFMEKNSEENIKLEQLAKKAHLSTNQFLRVFRKIYQTSPLDYLIQLRIQKSCEMMKNFKLSLTQIAYKTGFSDSNYFSRQFKKVMGQTPRSYRQTHIFKNQEN